MADAPAPQPDAMQGVLSTPTPLANPEDSAEPEYSCETLYIQNLNEKIKIDGLCLRSAFECALNAHTVLKATLRGLFKSYGEVVDVIAHSNLRMRGQAFVSFSSKESAQKALKDVQRFPLYSKPMVGFVARWMYDRDIQTFVLSSKYHTQGRGRMQSSRSWIRNSSISTRQHGMNINVCYGISSSRG
jgi:U2 small nuclear ribonucleoprotein B''